MTLKTFNNIFSENGDFLDEDKEIIKRNFEERNMVPEIKVEKFNKVYQVSEILSQSSMNFYTVLDSGEMSFRQC